MRNPEYGRSLSFIASAAHHLVVRSDALRKVTGDWEVGATVWCLLEVVTEIVTSFF